MKKKKIRKQLQYIIENEVDTLRAYVAQEALEQEDIKIFFSDLQQYECANGMVGSLIYYHDTHKFFDDYYDEIETLRYDLEDSMGEPMQLKDDLKNTLAWFAFEETAYHLASELNLI